MFPHQLIGKKAIRTNPVNYGGGVKDYSYTTDPLLILAATESHIVYERQEEMIVGRKRILDHRWIDNNWTDYDQLMKLADDKHIQSMNKLMSE